MVLSVQYELCKSTYDNVRVLDYYIIFNYEYVKLVCLQILLLLHSLHIMIVTTDSI